MMRKVFVLLTMVSCAFSCERFTFEEDFDELLSTEMGFCSNIRRAWTIGTYQSINMEGFHERSTQFIYPSEQISCISSPAFDMIPNGTIEVNIFMSNHLANDLIQVMVLDENNADAGTFTQWGVDFPEGWGTIRITILGNSPFRGLISLLGMASKNSNVLVDSFRYLPPGISESDCLLYGIDNDGNNVTTDGTTIDTTDYTTNDMTDNTTHNTTDVPNYDSTSGDTNSTTDGTTFPVTGDANSATDGTTFSVTGDANSTTDGITFPVTDNTIDNITNDSTVVIHTESTTEAERGEDILTSPTPICDDRKDGLIARIKIAMLVAVNISAEVVVPNPLP